jgi:hypothetical protein
MVGLCFENVLVSIDVGGKVGEVLNEVMEGSEIWEERRKGRHSRSSDLGRERMDEKKG